MRNLVSAVLLAIIVIPFIGPASVSADTIPPPALSIPVQEKDPGTIELSQLKPGDDVASAPTDLEPYALKVVESVASFQEIFKQQYGRYAQTLSPYLQSPTDGKAELPTNLLKSPNAGVSADTLWVLADLDAFPAEVWINVYDGPTGQGYEMNFRAAFNKSLYQRVINIGPEKWRERGWMELLP